MVHLILLQERKIVYNAGFNNLSFPSYHFLTYDSEKKNYFWEKAYFWLSLLNIQNMSKKEIKVFHLGIYLMIQVLGIYQ